jgi:hypothetical protein
MLSHIYLHTIIHKQYMYKMITNYVHFSYMLPHAPTHEVIFRLCKLTIY